MNNDTSKKCLCGAIGTALISALLGAGIALLLAPQSGPETRKDLKRLANRTKNYAGNLMEDTIDDVNLLLKNLKAKADVIANQGTDLTDKAKEEIMATLDQGQKAIEKQRKKFTELLGL